jgi:hypothetical protein
VEELTRQLNQVYDALIAKAEKKAASSARLACAKASMELSKLHTRSS